MADLTGSWLGTYWQNGEPTRFEATLVQGGNSLSGNILDDGPLGEANLTGEVVGRSVSFVKQYVTTQNLAIHYNGTISEEGDYMKGEWSFTQRTRRTTIVSGNWEAHRGGKSLMDELRKQLAAQTPALAGRS